jgi:hypothetical protein
MIIFFLRLILSAILNYPSFDFLLTRNRLVLRLCSTTGFNNLAYPTLFKPASGLGMIKKLRVMDTTMRAGCSLTPRHKKNDSDRAEAVSKE